VLLRDEDGEEEHIGEDARALSVARFLV